MSTTLIDFDVLEHLFSLRQKPIVDVTDHDIELLDWNHLSNLCKAWKVEIEGLASRLRLQRQKIIKTSSAKQQVSLSLTQELVVIL